MAVKRLPYKMHDARELPHILSTLPPDTNAFVNLDDYKNGRVQRGIIIPAGEFFGSYLTGPTPDGNWQKIQ